MVGARGQPSFMYSMRLGGTQHATGATVLLGSCGRVAPWCNATPCSMVRRLFGELFGRRLSKHSGAVFQGSRMG